MELDGAAADASASLEPPELARASAPAEGRLASCPVRKASSCSRKIKVAPSDAVCSRLCGSAHAHTKAQPLT